MSASQIAKQKRQVLESNLPSKIKVLGLEFDVVVTSLKGLHGDCDMDQRKIRIHSAVDLPTAKATLFHEAVHAAFRTAGLNEMMGENLEEALTRCIEHAFYHAVDISRLEAGVDKQAVN